MVIAFLWILTNVAHAQTGFPVTIQDAWGTSLTLKAPPQAMISLTLATDEILLALVDVSRIKAIDTFASDSGISNIADFARTFPNKISGDKEKILALRPDLVLVADWKEREFVQTLRDAGISVFVIKSPRNFSELTMTVKLLADLVGERARGQALLAEVDRKLARVDQKVALARTHPTILTYSFSGTTYGSGTSFDGLVQRAGLINAATQAGLKGWPEISKEQILQIDPDIIALPSWSFDGKFDSKSFQERFLNDPVFRGLRAVKSKRVVILSDRHLDSNSQYMAEGVEDLARTAWPELFRGEHP